MNFSKNEMIDMIYVLGESERNPLLASRIYAQKYPDRRHPGVKELKRLKIRFDETGSVSHQKHRRRRPATVEQNEHLVIQSVVENPHTSTRTISRQLQISQTSVSRILRAHKFHPYHLQFVQNLNENDYIARENFCLWVRNIMRVEQNFCDFILFTDESTFRKDGKMNIHNHHYYDNSNPHFIRALDHQHRWTLNVWGGIVGRRVLGPYFFEGTLTAEMYLHFLETSFEEYLEDLPLHVIRRLWFQHDGAPAHSSRRVCTHLNHEFEGRWIGRGGPVSWPARSPDLNKLDFFLWGYVLKAY